MFNNIQLRNDPTKLDTISTMRVMVTIPVLYMFMSHYLFQILRRLKGDQFRRARLDEQGRRLVLFGISGLLSMNMTQYSPFPAIMSWASLVCVIINHCFVFLKEIEDKYRNYGVMIYYCLQAAWFFGIIFLHVYMAL